MKSFDQLKNEFMQTINSEVSCNHKKQRLIKEMTINHFYETKKFLENIKY